MQNPLSWLKKDDVKKACNLILLLALLSALPLWCTIAWLTVLWCTTQNEIYTSSLSYKLVSEWRFIITKSDISWVTNADIQIHRVLNFVGNWWTDVYGWINGMSMWRSYWHTYLPSALIFRFPATPLTHTNSCLWSDEQPICNPLLWSVVDLVPPPMLAPVQLLCHLDLKVDHPIYTRLVLICYSA